MDLWQTEGAAHGARSLFPRRAGDAYELRDRESFGCSLTSTSEVSVPSLSEYSEAKMWDLFKDHSAEVGSKYSGDRTGKKLTDCITYVQNVIRHAYEQSGKADIGQNLRGYTEGIPLANYLVQSGWVAYYWNPDVRHPRDGGSEHAFSYQQAVKTGKYYGVKVNGFVVNYNLQTATRATPNNDRVYQALSMVKFAYGIARGGKHTFLFSYGMVYEVHWDQIGPSLYGRTPFYTYQWLSGLLLVPPGVIFVSDPR